MTGRNVHLAALYACYDVPVFPCREYGERAKSPYVANGFRQADASPDTLRQWARIYPNAVYGLPCAPNGLFVLDADRHGNGDGVANVMALFSQWRFDWRTVPAVSTPNNGLHFIFQRPSGLGKTKGKIADAVDVRDNGYIIAPGNALPDGRGYGLVNGRIAQLAAAIANRSLPLMPEALIAAATQPYCAPTPLRGPPTGTLLTDQLGGLVRAIVSAPAGNRNRVLFWASCRLGALVNQGVVGRDVALALLLEAGKQAGLGHRETYTTALSGLRQGQRDAARGC